MAKGSWITVDSGEFKERIEYKIEKHSPGKIKGIPWLVCKSCGLVYLRNQFTRWSVKMGCYADYHRDYKKMRNRAHG